MKTRVQTHHKSMKSLALALLLTGSVYPALGQSDTMILSSGTAGTNGTAALNLVLTSSAGSEPAAIQWTLTYSSNAVTALSAVAGSAATGAGKSLTCMAGVGSYTCV